MSTENKDVVKEEVKETKTTKGTKSVDVKIIKDEDVIPSFTESELFVNNLSEEFSPYSDKPNEIIIGGKIVNTRKLNKDEIDLVTRLLDANRFVFDYDVVNKIKSEIKSFVVGVHDNIYFIKDANSSVHSPKVINKSKNKQFVILSNSTITSEKAISINLTNHAILESSEISYGTIDLSGDEVRLSGSYIWVRNSFSVTEILSAKSLYSSANVINIDRFCSYGVRNEYTIYAKELINIKNIMGGRNINIQAGSCKSITIDLDKHFYEPIVVPYAYTDGTQDITIQIKHRLDWGQFLGLYNVNFVRTKNGLYLEGTEITYEDICKVEHKYHGEAPIKFPRPGYLQPEVTETKLTAVIERAVMGSGPNFTGDKEEKRIKNTDAYVNAFNQLVTQIKSRLSLYDVMSIKEI